MENWDLFQREEAARMEWERATDETVVELRARAEADYHGAAPRREDADGRV